MNGDHKDVVSIYYLHIIYCFIALACNQVSKSPEGVSLKTKIGILDTLYSTDVPSTDMRV